MPTFDRPDGTLVYDIAGEGPPLLLLCGLGGSRRYWDNLLPALTARFTVVAMDHMGCGETVSRRTEHTVPALADDVTALLDHLGIEAAHFIGHSTGAATGLVLGAVAPERIKRMVLFAGWPGRDPFFDLCFTVRRRQLVDSGVAAYHGATPLFLYPPRFVAEHSQTVQAVVDGLIAASPPTETMLARIDMLLAFDRRAELADIETAPLILCARDDQLTPLHCSEALAAGIPDARLAVMHWGGHAASQTAPEAFLSLVLDELSH